MYDFLPGIDESLTSPKRAPILVFKDLDGEPLIIDDSKVIFIHRKSGMRNEELSFSLLLWKEDGKFDSTSTIDIQEELIHQGVFYSSYEALIDQVISLSSSLIEATVQFRTGNFDSTLKGESPSETIQNITKVALQKILPDFSLAGKDRGLLPEA